MPSWLLPLLQAFAPAVIKFALKLLEGKYPGIKDILEEIIKYIESAPDKSGAVSNVQQALYTTATLPSLKKDV